MATTAILAWIAFLSLENKASPAPEIATYVGSSACAGCHQTEARLWMASQHKGAMQHATDGTVLGNFNDVRFDYFGVQSRFFRKNGQFFVETDGPDGALAVYEVKYTFGVDPLQQYLVPFPDGRLQVLPIAWDSRPSDRGGQRWFHLSANEAIKHDDVLHWTRLNQTWNFMCAECHSTGVRKNYDAEKDRFATTWTEISVGCEACHGQGSRHVSWAHEQQSWLPFGRRQDSSKGLLVHLDERNGITWSIEPQTGNVQRSSEPAALRKEVETCGLCHARRAAFHEGWIPGHSLSETHAVEALSRNTFDVDGQIRDVEEPYNYTPFRQSKMYAAGVSCSDCHEPHSGGLRLSGEGTCLQCHASNKYADVKHRQHAGVDPAPTCISCHMPTRTYMSIDVRHDHAFRVPRPDQSVALGTANACNDCHRDQSAQWAAAAIERWYGADRKGFQSYGPIFHAARINRTDAAALLSELASDRRAPAVARASALGELASRMTRADISTARAALGDPDPMVRLGALDMLENVPAAEIWSFVSPLLSDPSRGVRIRAAALLANMPVRSQHPADRARFDLAAAEFIAAQRSNAERPEARTALGNFLLQRDRPQEAEAEYRAALRLSPHYATAAINLADLYRQRGQDGEGEAVLRTALVASPRDAALFYSLGLTLTRLRRPDDALNALARAAELEPERQRYVYVYGIALHSSGRREAAVSVLKDALRAHPNDSQILQALISFSRMSGDATSALRYAEQLAAIAPSDKELAALIQELRRIASPPAR
ncbi:MULTISPECIES: tetratricopeptide repeat protein [Bradyrhizobium]|jgi:tetratricopeptide (TPR) repeat protein|nr:MULTISPECIES: tetratricopeptide repeat protein [Bradyrhizobium]MDU1490621.1 tetratricopeptide repeat protein [Bradyrhizobium sp.]MDU1545649.1 tetratricopeptide repeat protein [Bradyrhizobium sp.]MDU1688182.1 tetratricopeptide repeat protein [Bradyrhizobium sp.]MDU1803128.1 tetratricopeptide repeat protein [Bradyrhizobium sp.]MDU2922356.1 tetratricopeptide repeat protein [Bradyrhizobium sp.]